MGALGQPRAPARLHQYAASSVLRRLFADSVDLTHFSSSQLAVIKAGEGPLSVLAAPGSGKTTVLAVLIAYLVEHRRVPPTAILAILCRSCPPARAESPYSGSRRIEAMPQLKRGCQPTAAGPARVVARTSSYPKWPRTRPPCLPRSERNWPPSHRRPFRSAPMVPSRPAGESPGRSEEHTSELQSHSFIS